MTSEHEIIEENGKMKLNTKTGVLAVVLYFVGSFVITLFAAIFFRNVGEGVVKTVAEDAIDYSMYANAIVAIIILLACFVLFKGNLREIFYERVSFNLSKFYYAIPLVYLGIIIFALFNVQYDALSFSTIVLVCVASLIIGFNEEVVTRGLLLIGLRNDKLDEWKVYVFTLVIFSLGHLINLVAGGSFVFVLFQLLGGTVLYVTRRVFNTLLAAIILHGLWDTAFYLLPGPYPVNEMPPDRVLDIQFGAAMILFVVFILFLIFGRGLLRNSTTGWEQVEE